MSNTAQVCDKAREQLLLQRLAQGDRDAFWPLWCEHSSYLYYRALAWVNGNRSDTEDIVSQVLLKAWETLPSRAGGILNLRAWLTRMAYNLCMDSHRERQRHLRTLHRRVMPSINRVTDSPEASLLNQELGEEIQQALDTLPTRLREPFVLRCCEEMGYAEIARRLNLSNTNARKRVQHARERLRHQLAPQPTGTA